MITKPISFIQIAVNSDHIYGLTPDGDVYFREKIPFVYNSGAYNSVSKRDDPDEKKAWRKLFMECKVELPKGGQERDAQTVNEPEQSEQPVEVIVDVPAHKIYKDAATVTKVQNALKAKGFYKETNKSDGDLGVLTVKGIKEYQVYSNMPETGEIDLALCTALDLNKPDDNEIVIELSSNDVILEDANVTGGA